MQEALDRAVDYCISHGILSEILRLHRGEVLGMLLEEFDAEKYERTIRKEGIEIGLPQLLLLRHLSFSIVEYHTPGRRQKQKF